MVQYFIFSGIVLVEIVAFLNRGGGNLVSHIALTGITFALTAIWAVFLMKGKTKFLASKKLLAAYLAYGVFYAMFVFSFFVSKTPQYGINELLLFGSAGILFVIVSQTQFSQSHLRLFAVLIATLAAGDILYGCFIYVNTPFPRFVGSFIDLNQLSTVFANDFANFSLMALFPVLGLVWHRFSRKTSSLLLILAGAILLSGFVLSFSRAAWISAIFIAVSIGIWLLVYRNKFKQIADDVSLRQFAVKLGLIAIISCVLIAALQFTRSQQFPVISLFQKATFSADEGLSSASDRFSFWKGALQIIRENPLFGTGVQSFRYSFPQYQNVFGIAMDHPHNIFLKIGVENGVIATTSFLIFLAIVFVAILKSLRKNPASGALFFAAASLAGLLHNVFDYNFIVSNFVLFISFLGLAFSFDNFSPTAKNAKPAYAIPCVGIIIVTLTVLGLHDSFYNYFLQKGRTAFSQNQIGIAIPLLEKANINLIFKRDSETLLALAYKQEFEETKDVSWRNKEKKILENTTDQINAAKISRLADIYEEEGDYTRAWTQAITALNLDPQNRLKYYYQILALAKTHPNLKSNDYSKTEKSATLILAEYSDVLRNNRHNTILTDNPYYASQLFDILGMKKKEQELNQLWQEEFFKYVMKFGSITKSLDY